MIVNYFQFENFLNDIKRFDWLFRRITRKRSIYRESIENDNNLLKLSNCETKCYSIRRLLYRSKTCDNFDRLITKTINWFEEKRTKDDFDYENSVILYLIKNNFFVAMFDKNELVNLIDKNRNVLIDNRCCDRS